jgi:hypothetical protein
MIRQLARWYSETVTTSPTEPAPSSDELERCGTQKVWDLHPEQLLRFAEEAWAYHPS